MLLSWVSIQLVTDSTGFYPSWVIKCTDYESHRLLTPWVSCRDGAQLSTGQLHPLVRHFAACVELKTFLGAQFSSTPELIREPATNDGESASHILCSKVQQSHQNSR